MNNIKSYIKNYDEIVIKLAEILKQFKVDLRDYQTDVSLHFNMSNQIAVLDTYEFMNLPFVNVNSYDDNSVIYSDAPHYENVFSFFDSFTDFSRALKITESELRKEIINYYKLDENAIIDRWQIVEYIRKNNCLFDKLTEAYIDSYVNKNETYYLEKAKTLLNIFVDKMLALSK